MRHKDFLPVLPPKTYSLNWQLRKLLVAEGEGEIFGI